MIAVIRRVAIAPAIGRARGNICLDKQYDLVLGSIKDAYVHLSVLLLSTNEGVRLRVRAILSLDVDY